MSDNNLFSTSEQPTILTRNIGVTSTEIGCVSDIRSLAAASTKGRGIHSHLKQSRMKSLSNISSAEKQYESAAISKEIPIKMGKEVIKVYINRGVNTEIRWKDQSHENSSEYLNSKEINHEILQRTQIFMTQLIQASHIENPKAKTYPKIAVPLDLMKEAKAILSWFDKSNTSTKSSQ